MTSPRVTLPVSVIAVPGGIVTAVPEDGGLVDDDGVPEEFEGQVPKYWQAGIVNCQVPFWQVALMA